MGRKKISIDEYIKLAQEMEISWIGDIPERTIEKTLWKCSIGHEWEASYHSIKKGTGCPHCSNHVAKTLYDYRLLAQKIGYSLKENTIPKTTHHKAVWICQNHHEWTSSYKDIINGNRCPYCSNRLKKTSLDYKNLGIEKNLKWLGSNIKNTHSKTLWQCKEGHEFLSSYDKIRSGGYCPECNGKRRKNNQDYIALGKSRGYKWLQSEAIPTHKKTKWECSDKHYFEASYKSIVTGSGCPYCAGLAKKQESHYKILAIEKGYEWLGTSLPKNVTIKTQWKCRNGHIFNSSYNYIQSGNGCLKCSGLEKKNSEDFKNLANSRKIEWIADKVENVMTKTKWKCHKGHTWLATYDSIRSGTSCPECQNIFNGARASKIQIEICKKVNGELNYPIGKYTIDIALFEDDLKIAIEYDCWYWHANRLLQDKERDLFLHENGWKIIRIKTRNQKPSNVEIFSAIEKIREGNEYVEVILDDWGQGNIFRTSSMNK